MKKCKQKGDVSLEELLEEMIELKKHKDSTKKLEKEIKDMAKTIAELNSKISQVINKVNDVTAKEAAFEAAVLLTENKQDQKIAELQAQIGTGSDVQAQFDSVSGIEGSVDAVTSKLDTAIAEQHVKSGS